eukprot:TRINITY_DN16248_c0_g2_i4.p2 TRINITY_DN16248_c0_g2~~TRINITY_DN16248_c0_g2_i4.p2  ORF type:complete len:205 (+),score=68.63 TRINITY_DN16248_c0_g2_i4:165-779(+)
MEHEEGSDSEQAAPKPIYKREKIQSRLDRINKVTLKIFNKHSKHKLKTIPWIEQLAVTSEEVTAPVSIPNTHEDLRRELAFYNMALANTCRGIEKLEEMKVPIDRPVDYLVEMMKSDAHMRKVKQRLLTQENSINKFEERKRRVHDQKFAKKIKAVKEQEKHKKKKMALEEIEKWKKNIKEKKECARSHPYKPQSLISTNLPAC